MLEQNDNDLYRPNGFIGLGLERFTAVRLPANLEARARTVYRPAMADEPDNLVLQYLRRIDVNVTRLSDDVRDLKVRMTGVEEGLMLINRRMDRFEQRLDRIERRLELVDHAH